MHAAYYNEFDPYAAQWLRNLIAAGHIAPGEVDERSITDVQPDDLRGFTQCHFFAGIGIWSLAARLAGWPDDRPLWTGSCPCQPFSVAGKQKGFADERHLWPLWRDLIAVRRPPVIAGEQVAAASDWLRIVRSDLEALGYAVGCQAIQAASAGADHLRDRYWFVADQHSERWSERATHTRPEAREDAGPFDGSTGVGLADAYDTRSQGRPLSAERAGERATGQDGLAHTDQPCTSEGREQRSGEQCGSGGDQEACDSGNVADSTNQRSEWGREARQWDNGSQNFGIDDRGGCRPASAGAITVGQDFMSATAREADSHGWVIGADGKSRRVKPGICLLVNGHPNRVAKLRAFGNAIDPRPAAQWIGAFLDCERLEP